MRPEAEPPEEVPAGLLDRRPGPQAARGFVGVEETWQDSCSITSRDVAGPPVR